MSISLDGLSSNLDTTALITQLMQAEAVPQTLLKNKAASTNNLIAALQALNTRVASLADLASAAGKPQALDLFTASSSASSVVATVKAGANAGSIDITVGALAQGQVSVSAPMTTWSTPPTLTIVGAGGTATEITPASASLDDVAKAVNASAAGVSATKVASGVDPVSGQPQYRLQFASKATGAASAFSVYQGSAAAVTGGTATNVLTAAGAASVRSAQDASITLWAGSPAQQVITSATNTFADLLPGVSVTVSAVTTDPVAVTVARDDKAISNSASTLVNSLNSIFTFISQQTAVTSSASPTGGTTTSAGVLTADSTVRETEQRLMSAASLPVNGHSPSEYGISITKDGAITFDPDKFAAALAADPDTVKSAVQQLATRVSDAAAVASDKYTGVLTSKITGQQSFVSSLNKQVGDWDLRLATRKATLQKMYSDMEVQLGTLKSQQSWLDGQLSGLSASS
jgi:flagellar hook-associated protein 2